MHTFNKILIAYDGSDGSKRAVEIGMNMQKKFNSTITLLKVLEENVPTTPVHSRHPEALSAGGHGLEGLNMYAPNVRQRVPDEEHLLNTRYDPTEEAIQELQGLLASERIDGTAEVLVGDPAKSICHFAELNDSDLIIIGNRGLGGLKKLILGSVSDKVTNSADCPVLVAK